MRGVVSEQINTHDQLCAAGGGVALIVSYAPGRDRYITGWHVYRVNAAGEVLETDSGAAWYDHRRKAFPLRHEDGKFHDRQKAAAQRAIDWIREKGWYDGAWARNRMGDWVPFSINKQFPLRRRTK